MSASLGRILVVDDEVSVREVLSEYFVGQGYTVETAADGDQALTILPKYRPGVVLLDVRMPGVDGVEVLKRIRAIDEAVAIIMVTANEDVGLARETLKLGAFDYVAKPFDFQYLDQAVTLGLLRSSGGGEPEAAGAQARDGHPRDWTALVLAAFQAARAMAAGRRESTGTRMESAALAAAREAAAGRGDAAGEALSELEILASVASDLGDLPPTSRQSVEAAIAAARASLSAAG
jgi:two-component system response regulator (stage 0 sporulation protein F)